MTNLIGISGKKGSGKDTVANLIIEITQAYQIKRFSGAIKHVVEQMTGIPAEDQNKQEVKDLFLPEWNRTVRELQKDVGEAIRNNVHLDGWIIPQFMNYNGQYWIFPDTRHPNEYDAINKRRGIVIRIERDGLPPDDHISETALDGAHFDYYIFNNAGLGELRVQVLHMLAHFGVINKGRIGGEELV